jgi:hypothetical protein
LFRAAGIPAPRVTHAVVTLNGRRLGLYVLKEGFTEDFLGCYFEAVGGNLYEPADGHDVNQRLKRNSVEAPAQDDTALHALAEAALDPDPGARWSRLNQVLDTGEFVDFMAMEVMVGHRDGYSLARNNYRVYEDLDSHKIMFFPQGMDQLFGNPTAAWMPHMAGLAARAVMETSEGQRQYRARFATLFTNVFHASTLQGRVDQVVTSLRPAITGAEFESVSNEAGQLKERIARRAISLTRQLSEPERALLVFTNGVGRLGEWEKVDESAAAILDRVAAPDQTASLRITALADSGASWRTHVLLERGRYRFDGVAKVQGVRPLHYGKYQGAGLRVAGGVRDTRGLAGDSDWRPLSAQFAVTEETQAVELLCELRASAGTVWFQLDSLRLVQLPSEPPAPAASR